ncbi:MAG: terpene cyclase/mutase family protein [Planctomycetes bacterium]|nr:terpene cyclase/mutase family protein [Planctomycetota bacterium]
MRHFLHWNLVAIQAAIILLSTGAVRAADPKIPNDGPRTGILADPLDFSQPPSLPKIDAPAVGEIDASIDRGVQFLLSIQNANGSWGSATKTKGLNVYAPVPGSHHAFRAATTSLCISALLEVSPDEPEAMESVDRAEDWLLEHVSSLRRATGDAIYNVWGHAYSIQAMIRLRQRHSDDSVRRDRFDALIREQFDMLRRYESVDGGWGYYDFRYQAQRPTSSSISFVNGTVLVALAEAKAAGIEPPERIVRRALAATKRQQKKDFSYVYGEYLKYRPMLDINRPAASLGRTQCCNCALRMWGDESITDNVAKNWLYRLYVRNGWLDIGRKRPIPHESWFQVAGYFYYYGHYYAALSLEQLPESEQGPYKPLLAKLMLDRQEKNGSWWDYPLYNYHQQYGTAFALMTLQRCK